MIPIHGLLELTSPYLSQVALWVLGFALLVMTAYRHEMSCNAVYDDFKEEELKLYSFYSDDEESDEELENGGKAIGSGTGTGAAVQRRKSIFSESILVLAPDLQVHILTFLTPGDLTRLACVSREFRHAMDGIPPMIMASGASDDVREWDGEFSNALWMAMWKRDYASIVTNYKYGVEALKRSLETLKGEARQKSSKRQPIPQELLALFEEAGIKTEMLKDRTTDRKNTPTNHDMIMKEFYFLFQQTWLPYLIAGHANFDSCLIGLHGHLFDMSDFLHDHPGSPETLLMQSGRDATIFFESVGHSSSARSLALSMTKAFVGVVDWGCCASPQNQHNRRRSRGHSDDGMNTIEVPGQPKSLQMESDRQIIVTCGISERQPHSTFQRSHLLPHKRSKPKKIQPLTLHSIRLQLQEQERIAQTKAQCRMKKESFSLKSLPARLGEIHVFWDPIGQHWVSWYIDTEFQPIFEAMDI
jgi:cytochrome b involved in lipid metabolism